MATLGIVFLWFGYTAAIGGLAKIKAAYGAAPALSLSDLALPTHRATYLAAVQAWSTGSASSASDGSTSTGSGSTTTATATATGSSTGPAKGIAPGLGQAVTAPPSSPLTVFGSPPGIPSPTQQTSGAFVPAT